MARIFHHILWHILARVSILYCGIIMARVPDQVQWHSFGAHFFITYCGIILARIFHHIYFGTFFFTSTVALCWRAFSSHLLWHCIGAHFHLHISCGIGVLPEFVCLSIFAFVGVLVSERHRHISRNYHSFLLRFWRRRCH